MSDLKGGVISEILAQQATADRTAEDAARTATDGRQLATRVQDDVDHIAAALESDFHDLSGRLQDAIRRTSQQLHGTEWHGRSRDALVAFDADLATTAQGFLTSCEEGVVAFRGRLTGLITEFADTIHADFARALEDVRMRYDDAARVAGDFARRLDELDATAITY